MAARGSTERWTPSPGMDKYGMVKAEDKHLAGSRVVQIIEESDHSVEVTIPHLYWEKWITDAGNVSLVAMTCNRIPNGITRTDKDEILQRRERCERAGWVHYDTGYPKFANSPGQPFLENPKPGEGWLAKRDEYIKTLRDRHAKRSESFQDKWRQDREQVMRDLGMTMAEFTQSLKDVVAQVSGGRKRGPASGGE